VKVLRMVIKLVHRIFVLEGHLWNIDIIISMLWKAEELASLLMNSFLAIPVWPGTHNMHRYYKTYKTYVHINLMPVSDSIREYHELR